MIISMLKRKSSRLMSMLKNQSTNLCHLSYLSMLLAAYLLVACLFCINDLNPVRAAGAQSGKETIQTLIAIFANLKDGQILNTSALAEAANYIDYSGMAERALGEKYWQKLTAVQKSQYIQNFKSLIERRYYRRWHKIFAHSAISYGTEGRKGTNIVVPTTIVTGKNKKCITWTLAGSAPKVIDLTAENGDIIIRLQKRFQKKVDDAGVPVFLTWLVQSDENH
jgi:ABC-type transporter MlaC component